MGLDEVIRCKGLLVVVVGREQKPDWESIPRSRAFGDEDERRKSDPTERERDSVSANKTSQPHRLTCAASIQPYCCAGPFSKAEVLNPPCP